MVPRGDFHCLDPADRLRATLDLPVFVENDGTAVAIAELFERLGRELNDFAVVYLDGAIGGDLVLEQELPPGCHRKRSGTSG